MKQTLRLIVRGMDFESIQERLGLIEGVSILDAGISTGGLRSDSGAIDIIVDLAKVTLPALISGVTAIWAAKKASRSKEAQSDSIKVTVQGEKERSVMNLSVGSDIASQHTEWPNLVNITSIKIEVIELKK